MHLFLRLRHLICFSCLLLVPPILQAQSTDSTKIKTRFKVGAGAVTTEYFSDEIRIDRHVYIQRALRPSKNFFTGELTDQPHEHGSIYGILSSKTSFKPGYDFYANLMMEYRGESYGANDLNNAVVFPQLYGRLKDTLSLKSKPLHLMVHIGDLFQFKLNQGLQVYNVDVQAMLVELEYENYHFKIVHMPDHSRGIGVGLEELFSFNLGWRQKQHRFNFAYEFNSNVPYNFASPSIPLINTYYTHLSFDYEWQWSPDNRLYFQLGSRRINEQYALNSSAIVAGAEMLYTSNKIKWTIKPEIRYYSSLYNLGYYTPYVLFRDNSTQLDYANTVGRYLYPLKNYNYPFSQWAVFTEYQEQDILGVGLNTDLNIQLGRKTGMSINGDYLGVDSDAGFFSYFFYTFNLYYEPVKGMYLKGLLTNKTMNLDAHFQTFYQTKIPSIGLELRKDLDPLW